MFQVQSLDKWRFNIFDSEPPSPVGQGTDRRSIKPQFIESPLDFHRFSSNFKFLISVWHGETNIASYATDGGEYSDSSRLEKMFDDDSETMWHNNADTKNKVQTVTVNFVKARVFIM